MHGRVRGFRVDTVAQLRPGRRGVRPGRWVTVPDAVPGVARRRGNTGAAGVVLMEFPSVVVTGSRVCHLPADW
ncbi:hypothetical protein NUM3379_23800 [Kineococcus sp. NUM-3379]